MTLGGQVKLNVWDWQALGTMENNQEGNLIWRYQKWRKIKDCRKGLSSSSEMGRLCECRRLVLVTIHACTATYRWFNVVPKGRILALAERGFQERKCSLCSRRWWLNEQHCVCHRCPVQQSRTVLFPPYMWVNVKYYIRCMWEVRLWEAQISWHWVRLYFVGMQRSEAYQPQTLEASHFQSSGVRLVEQPWMSLGFCLTGHWNEQKVIKSSLHTASSICIPFLYKVSGLIHGQLLDDSISVRKVLYLDWVTGGFESVKTVEN